MPASKNFSNVNVGTSPNAGDGDILRDAFVKVNNNLNSLYSGGQVIGYVPDNNFVPGYTWEGDRDTGMYRKAAGKIGFALNSIESLVLDENGTISWFGSELSTKSYVSTLLNTFSGGINAANITVTINAGANVQTNVTVNGLPVVSQLPSIGNHEGRIAYYAGDIWIFSGYPINNGAGLPANPGIARLAGSDYRWVRFRSDAAMSIGTVRPSVLAEGTLFYETGNAIPYVYLSGGWRTLASIISQSNPQGLEVLISLPAEANPTNYTGRTVVVGSNAFIYIGGTWNPLSNYVSGASGISGTGIASGAALPSTAGANVGDLFRKSGINAGLYIYDTGNWIGIPRYVSNNTVMRIATLATLPADVSLYDAGALIIVNGVTYILNSTKTSWDLFTPYGANANASISIAINPGTIGNVQLSANAVISSKLAPNAVFNYHLVSNTINSREIAVGAIDSNKLASNSVVGSKIQNNTITGDKLAANSVDGSKIILGTIGRSQLASNIFTAASVSANNLSEISSNIGVISKGVLRSTDGKMVIDIENKIIRIEI